MKEYITLKPIKAVQWNGDNLDEVKQFCTDLKYFVVQEENGDLWIENFFYVPKGDFVTSTPTGCLEIITSQDMALNYREVDTSVVHEREAWLMANPEAFESVKRGLADVAAGRLHQI